MPRRRASSDLRRTARRRPRRALDPRGFALPCATTHPPVPSRAAGRGTRAPGSSLPIFRVRHPADTSRSGPDRSRETARTAVTRRGRRDLRSPRRDDRRQSQLGFRQRAFDTVDGERVRAPELLRGECRLVRAHCRCPRVRRRRRRSFPAACFRLCTPARRRRRSDHGGREIQMETGGAGAAEGVGAPAELADAAGS